MNCHKYMQSSHYMVTACVACMERQISLITNMDRNTEVIYQLSE